MQIINKTKLTAIIATVLLMTSAFTIMIITAVQAQELERYDGGALPLPSGVTPDRTLDSTAHLSFIPNPVGVGQTILVNIWMQPPIHRSRYFVGFKVTITGPDGNEHVRTLDSYYGDGTSWFEYQVNQVGIWTVKFDFPGAYYPAGIYVDARTGRETTFPTSLYYTPSSDGPYELEVQEDMVLSWPPSPLPTDYWTRPISPENREWWPIAGNYPFTGMGGGPDWPANTNTYMSNYLFTPWVLGPTTAHIVWRDQGSVQGGINAETGQWVVPINYDESFSTARGAYSAGPGHAGNPNILFAGRLYGKVQTVWNGEPMYVWRCTDVRTGEVIWEQPWTNQMPTMISPDFDAIPVPGATQRADRLFMRLVYLGGGRLIKYSPTDGRVISNISIAPLSSGKVYADPYVLSVQNLGGGNYRLINWSMTAYSQYMVPTLEIEVLNNITWPWNNIGNYHDFEAGIAVRTESISDPAIGVSMDARIMAASLKTGQLLWNITADLGYGIFSGSTGVADHGKFAVRFNDGYYHCWDLYTGKKLWRTESTNWPWDTFAAYGVASAYGYIYDNTYAGIRAIDWETGKIDWIFEAPTPYAYETPYKGQYPWFSKNIIADGKLYAYNQEHSPTAPLTRGLRLFCINATTGEGIWNITGCMVPGVVADGYLTACNWYDGYMYVFGKGKSTTTVSAPQTSVAKGTTMMITGTVLDQSPGQPGTPCVSADSMTTQMEYLHMQHPIDGLSGNEIITGVPVLLTAISKDGSECVDIGTTITEGYYGTFGFAWTPENEGTYEIVASFAGDNSYGSSGAATYVTVGPAPTAGGIIEPEQSLISTDMAIIIAVVAVAIIAAVAYLALRKRK